MINYNRWPTIDKSILQFVRELCHAFVKPGVCVNLNKPTSVLVAYVKISKPPQTFGFNDKQIFSS